LSDFYKRKSYLDTKIIKFNKLVCPIIAFGYGV
jgi:hypothetical protein